MCFWFDAWCCFGPGPGDDDDYCRSPRHHAIPGKGSAPQHHHHPPPALPQRNSHYPYDQQGVVAHHANGHRAPPRYDHHQQLPVAAAADEEEYRKASNDARRGGGHSHGHAAGAAYVYSGPQGTVNKQAARSAMIARPDGEQRREGAHHFYPAHRGGTAGHRHRTTPTTTPSIADYGRF